LFIPQVILEYGEPWWNDIDRGKPKNSEENVAQCYFVHHKTHMGTNLGLCSVRPATDCMSHGTAYVEGLRSFKQTVRIKILPEICRDAYINTVKLG
jgi:hypothetical protein